MKIILSRKGFDASAGGVASPIFPSGEMSSLPIPELSKFPNPHSKRYQEIQVGKHSLGPIVNDLTEGKIQPEMRAHLDPDLNALSVPRLANWRPAFGQAGVAEKHLEKQGVKEGDVFIFYGWFRKVELASGTYRYVRGAPNLHVIFGWLQVEQRISAVSFSRLPWAVDHPHCKEVIYSSNDCIYISGSHLHLPGTDIHKPGAGVFHRFAPALCLTDPDCSTRSVWQLPNWFYYHKPPSGLSYHGNEKRWEQVGEMVRLRSVGRGQEFVLDCQDYPEAVQWFARLLCLCDTGKQT